MATSMLGSGPWHGHLEQVGALDRSTPTRILLRLNLELDRGRVHGHGLDAQGDLVVEGSIDDAGRAVLLSRQDGLERALVGTWDPAAGALQGRYRVVNGGVHGRFHLEPGEGPLARETNTRRAPVTATLDLAAVIFQGEQQMRTLLEDDPALAARLHRDEAGTSGPHRATLETAVQLQATLAPVVHAAAQHCLDRLGVRLAFTLHCQASAQPGLMVLGPRQGRLTLVITSGALERLGEPELRFVIGHELGHLIFDHDRLAALRSRDALSAVSAMRYYAWLRYADLTADRVGLICCGDLRVAARALFKLASGVGESALLADVEALVEDVTPASEAPSLPGDDWAETHPYGALRLRALQLFERSTTYRSLVGQAPGKLTDADLEREVARVVALMNPTFLHQTDHSAELGEFVVLGAIATAVADGRLLRCEQNEIRRLAAVCGQEAHLARLTDLPLAAQQVRMVELAEVLTTHLSSARRVKLLEDLAVVAWIDHHVAAEEVAVLHGAADLLAVLPEVVDRALPRLTYGLR
jgi:Zn-dependent protease with chaperone function/uncharacterized tellurite resistance protein B-like protein